MCVYVLHHIMVSIVKISNQSQSQSQSIHYLYHYITISIFIYIHSFPVSTGQAALKYTDPLVTVTTAQAYSIIKLVL